MNLIAPLGLALGVLAAPILAMYFLKIKRKRVIVPSTLLWQVVDRAERTARPFDKFKRNLLLLLQLLLLAALALALARPYLETSAQPRHSVVLIVDTSASMGAADVPQGTRLDAAIDEGLRILSRLGPTDEVMVIGAGSRTEVRVPFTHDHSAAATGLRQLRVSQAEGTLREGIQLALSMVGARQDVSIRVVSDGGTGPLQGLSTEDRDLLYVPVGRSGANSGILAVDLRRHPTNELERQLFTTVQNFGKQAVDADVRLFIDDRLVGTRTAVLEPDVPLSMVFSVDGASTGVLRVELEADDDHLKADDTAWLVLGAVSERKVLLVGGDWLTARALAADPRLKLTTVGRDALAAEHLEGKDAVVVSGPVPPLAAGHNLLVIGPHAGGPVRFGGSWDLPRILGWRRTHPVLRFIEWSGVNIAKARRVEDAGGLVPLVEGDEGPLILAGERGGARYVQLAFDPLESDLPLRVGWPVLLMNSVGWLTEGATSTNATLQLPTGTPFVRRAPEGLTADQVRAEGPEGNPLPTQVSGGLVRVRDTRQAGLYTVRIGAQVERFAANLLSPRESDIAVQDDLLFTSEGAVPTRTASVGKREIWRELLLFALLVLLGEWALWNRRKSG